MHAIASSTSESAPTMCDGSNFSDSRGAGGAGQNREQQEYRGQPRHRLGGEKPGHDDKAGNDRDQADDHVHGDKSRQAHTQDHDTLPFLVRRMLRLRIENCHLRAAHGGNSDMGDDQKRDSDAQVSCRPVTNRADRYRILAIEKFDQFRDDLVQRFFHQPMAPAFDEHALDIGRHHPALLDQERTAGFFA